MDIKVSPNKVHILPAGRRAARVKSLYLVCHSSVHSAQGPEAIRDVVAVALCPCNVHSGDLQTDDQRCCGCGCMCMQRAQWGPAN